VNLANTAWLVALGAFIVACLLYVGEVVAIPFALLLAWGALLAVTKMWVREPGAAKGGKRGVRESGR
jgi:hypothetical protein